MCGQDLCVSRVITARRQTLYAAFLDANAVAAWLPPQGMTAQVHAFDAREGDAYEIALKYLSPKDRPRGKTTEDTDTVRGRFATLIPDERIVQVICSSIIPVQVSSGPAPHDRSGHRDCREIPPSRDDGSFLLR
jgi:uncharacterized protein YndB with AHSA1/START domain